MQAEDLREIISIYLQGKGILDQEKLLAEFARLLLDPSARQTE